ncbi:MAG: endopeptidase La [Clostridia bacterium]|nr:endopeptidase La [Clostridia bacterium]
MPHTIEKAEKMTLPVLTLRGIVAFPSALLNFELTDNSDIAIARAAADAASPVLLLTEIPGDEPELDELLAEQLEQMMADGEEPDTDSALSALLGAAGGERPSHASAALYRVGTVARIKQLITTPEKNARLIVEGLSRAQVLSLNMDAEMPCADVLIKAIMLRDTDDVRVQAALHALHRELPRILRYLPATSEELMRTAAGMRNPGQLSDFIAANVLVKCEDKQAILECFEPMERVETLLAILESERELLACEADIQNKVRANLARNQKEYYLREQIRVIQDELGEGANSETAKYEERIMSAPLSEEARAKLLKENDRLARTPFGSQEAGVITTYLDTVLDLPWGKKSKDRLNIATAKRILDEDHDGLDKVKDRILEYLAVKQMHPELKNQVLCLVGPPGVGKTSVAASIARAMKRKYVRVSLGGIRDESDIRGHRRTYLGSMPGRIMNAIALAGTSNPLILLDEIDKMSESLQGDPAAALLEVLDGEQNRAFRDHFIELPFDLSDCLFIATANTLDTVPRPLIDRMEIIEMKMYTKREKLNIAKHHLLPKQLQRHGLNKTKFRMTDDAICELIDYYTHEAGVRNLERTIASLIRKAARKMIDEGVGRVTVGVKNIKEYLGARKLLPEHIDETDAVGTVNGLAYTELGGDMLRIEAAVLDGTGKLELTGSLGDVMKESARAAITYTRSIAAEYGIPSDFYEKKDIHIHVPEGAVPKDGPSAGVTMLTALVSALTGRCVRRDIAMTGEITLRGRVLPIGGLREKTMAAYNAGVKTVLIPAENERDLEDIDALARDNLTFIPCSHASEILKNALL